MSHSNSSNISDCPSRFLEHHPYLSDSFADYNLSPSQVTAIIEPVLQAKNRCRVTRYYIQAITTGQTTFLACNLADAEEIQATAIASSWLVGRSPACAVALLHPSVSRRHAIVGYQPTREFYITDLGSSNGTWVNGRRLSLMKRQLLEDGDLLLLGTVRVEFFVASCDRAADIQIDSTCY